MRKTEDHSSENRPPPSDLVTPYASPQLCFSLSTEQRRI